MVINICLLLEVLSMVICIHSLYGEKFRLDITTTSFFTVYMIIMTTINYYNLPKVYTMIIYPVLAVYCGIKFGFKLKNILVNLVLCIIVVGGIQMLVTLPFCFMLNKQVFRNLELLIMNFLILLIVVFLIPKLKVYKISFFLQKQERALATAFGIGFLLIIFFLLSYKELTQIEFRTAILLFVSIVFIFILAEQLSLSRIKSKEIETELKMHKMYEDSFQGLIKNIRLRQHEFDNHISTIYSQHYIYKTHEELVKAQKDYCQVVAIENRFNKLLTTGNPIIIGFLYGKFIEIDKKGIDVAYKVDIKEMNIGVPIYKIVEILGNFINNAVEALESMEYMNKLYVSLLEGDNKIEMEVRNESPFINHDEIDSFFVKGFSSKGENRGLGLYNTKRICEMYGLILYCENIDIDNTNWFSFKVIKGAVKKVL